MSFRQKESGQAAAEFAAAIPLIVLFMVFVIELGLVMVQQLAVERVAREAARVAAVTSSTSDIQAAAFAATDLSDDRLEVRIGRRPEANGMVKVTVQYESKIVMPVTGTVLFRPQLQAKASMRVEDRPVNTLVR